ncbi:MAG TPA: NUDIX domain-containing protein [Candidatus Nanoarchaeia archaeon]|nr:NUDIX domain-containing protein [Candidatus Nanoarchaeia archaeon]
MKKGIDYIGVGTGALIFNDEGKVFLAKRGQKSRNERGKWDFPGGSVEFGETCENTIKREIKEEFGMEIAVVDFLMYGDDLMPKEKQHWLSISFIARHIGGKPKIMEPDKCSEIKWAEFATIDPESLTIPSRRCFYKYREINHPIQ